MRKMILTVLFISLASTFGIAVVLGKCVEIYTGSQSYRFIFQFGFHFLSSLFVSHFIVQNYIKILWK